MLVGNQIPFSVFSVNAVEEESEKTPITLDENFAESLVTESKTYDGTPLVKVDFSNVQLNGVADGHNVELTGTAEFQDVNVGKQVVVVSDLALQGDDAKLYTLELTDEQDKIMLTADITPKELRLIPDETTFTEGLLPKWVEYTYAEEDVVDADKGMSNINLTALLTVAEIDGKYVFQINDPTATGNPNYIAVIESGTVPVVNAANAPVVIPEAVLTKGTANTLSQYDFGVVANGSVKLSVSAKSDQSNLPITFTLSDGQSVAVNSGGEIAGEQGQYLYTAEFTLTNPDWTQSYTISSLTCTASNGTKSANTTLQFKIESTDTAHTTLILEKLPPFVSDDMMAYYENFYKNPSTTIQGNLVDVDSGIKEVQYMWDDDSNWQSYSVDPNQKNEYVWFTVNRKDNNTHGIRFKITDHAGNVYEMHDYSTYASSDGGADNEPPIITYAKLETIDETPLATVLRVLSFGNYTNQKLQLTIKAEDQSSSMHYSGMGTISLMDGKDNAKEIDIAKADTNDQITFEATFTIEPNVNIEDWYICVSDSQGWPYEISVLEALKKYKPEKTESTKTTSSTDETAETTETTTVPPINWDEVNLNKWVFDNEVPEIIPDWVNCNIIEDASEKRYYFGLPNDDEEAGKLNITLKDNGSLRKVIITESTGSSIDEMGEAKEYLIEVFDEETQEISYCIDSANMETGWYEYVIKVYDATVPIGDSPEYEIPSDYIGNAPRLETFKFYVDKTVPEGNIEVDAPSVTPINEKDWISEKDASGNNQEVTFRLYAESAGAALYGGKINVNDASKEISADDFIWSEEDEKYYVDMTIDTDEIKCNSDHVYSVNAEFWTESNNMRTASYTLYVDTSNPEIHSFTVDTKNDAAANILNVLTFGVFASDSLVLSVNVSDVEYDSGIDYVTINYDGLTEPVKMTKNNDGNYYTYLDIDTQIFQSEIEVTVYDKIGKTNATCPNIKNTEGTTEVQRNFVMIETVPPEVTLLLPETDSISRSDGQIWYRQHKNSETDQEKVIALQVRDVNSGIREVKMSINGVTITPEMEVNGTALPTIESTSSADEANCDELQYSYSLEKIAEMIQANEDGSYIIEIMVVDNAGNVNSDPVDGDGNTYSDAKPIYYRDIVNPSVVQFTFDPATSDNISEVSEFIEQLEYGFYFKKEFDAVVSTTDEDPSSQLDNVVFRLVPYEDGAEQEAGLHEVTITEGKASYTIPAGFKGQIYAQAYDKVGNISDEKTPQGFVIDDVAPVITIEPLPDTTTRTDGNSNRLYTGTVQFRVTISDPKSGLKEISYSKSSELDSYDAIVNTISNTDGYSENMFLANGWEITKTDVNLITEVSQVFTFDSDDNDIILTFNATDRAANACEPVSSEAFSIDTIAPEVSISNNDELINGMYYPGSTAFTITVTERNFDADLMAATITNSFTGVTPSVTFQSNGSVHTATVTFFEGDFEFSFSGEDRAGHVANISYNGGEINNYFFEMFNVDATAPVIKTNFSSFGDDADEGIYYNTEQTAKIEVIEHNFDASDMGILVEAKASGTGHSADDEKWSSIGYSTDWKHDGDTHTLEIPFATEGVYRIKIVPIDRAGNKGVMEKGSVDHTPVYEVDMTAPEFYARNNELSTEKGFVVSPYFAVYDEKLKNAAAPTVEFTDLNFDRIEIEAQVYTPIYENGMELGTIEMSPLAADLSKSINQSKFTLDGFDKDGVYAFTFVAVDKAGNRSEPISDTYFRMVETDVLAYIYNSKKPTDSGTQDGTGYYSLVNEDGRSISKKAADFQNLDILVIKPTTDNAAGTLVLREDENQYSPQEYLTIENEEISETATLSYIHLPGNYFSEAFRDDSLDTRMYLSVSIRDDVYLDLATIHIDNEAPTATLPENFNDWHNYFFKDEVTISLTDISETLDKNATKVYECPRNGERIEIPFTYDSETDTLSFTLTKGQHHIDITLVDEAGNEWNIDRVRYLQVGNFWLYIGVTVLIVIATGIGFFVWRKKRR